MSKKNVALVFGGRSPEHEVSLRSAKNVSAAIKDTNYNKFLIGISKEGTWYLFQSAQVFEKKALLDKEMEGAEPVSLVCKKGAPVLVGLKTHQEWKIDIAFPVLHGSYGEDGTIQGLFRMMNLPFVGCDVFASAAGMDKEVMKRILADAKVPAARYEVLRKGAPANFATLTKNLGLPFFIKPANAGSSVGVHKIKSEQDFQTKLADAFKYDTKVLAEEFVQGREIEISVMGPNLKPKASLPGEVIPTHEFYSYEAKYIDENGAHLKIPAPLSGEEVKKIQEIALKTYQVMGCEGLTRVDFFLKSNGDAYINEINTLPGFTNISMYPKMWESSGLGYSELISELIQQGFDRHVALREIETSFENL
jgi:D-alanine-D-alanine ligase